MYTFKSQFSFTFQFLQKLSNQSKPTSIQLKFNQNYIKNHPKFCSIMSSTSKTTHFEPKNMSHNSKLCNVPCVANPSDMDGIVRQTFERYSMSLSVSSKVKRHGKGVCIVWFRNDLRVLDNEALFMGWNSSEIVLPVYCVDPRLFETTHSFGFPKTGGLRAKFLTECLADLRKNLQKHGLNLLIQHGKPEEVLPVLAETFGAHTIYAQKETCSEELNVETRVLKGLHKVTGQNGAKATKLQLVWGSTMYHLDDLPYDARDIHNVYTQFRKSVESKCNVRGCIKIPASLGPPPEVEDWGTIPSVEQLSLNYEKTDKGLAFIGGESAALCRVHEYFWKKDLLKTYKETRNGMLGPDYSTKFSPWLASGSLSPRFIYAEVKKYERERLANDSTYWVLFELLWRDYFRFLSIKCGNSIFHLGGPRRLNYRWSQDSALFDAWKEGKTGYPLIDANMKELAATGFMSNRGRQIVCSFLVRDMGIDWRMGAEWFESCLLDYDPCSNYGNWTYGAGVGNDPREDRYFSIPKQAKVYDPDGEYVAYWLPELKRLPKDKRHSPGFSYLKPIVPLKYGNSGHQGGHNATTSRKTDGPGGSRSKSYTRR